MKKATYPTLQPATSADKNRVKPSVGSRILMVVTIMIAAVVTSTVAMVATTAIGEVSRQINSAILNDFFDLIGTIFFTILNVIAAGTESIQMGLMIGFYAGIAMSVAYLVYSWFAPRMGSQLALTGRR